MLVQSERGQALILFVGIVTVILVIAAIVVDFGLWFAERRSAQRAADLAAAAAAMELPFNDVDAEAIAVQWADKNGFDDGVSVTLLCRNTISSPGLCLNPDPASGPANCEAPAGCDTVRVTVTKDAPRLFTALPLLGIDDIEVVVEAGAAAGVTFGSSSQSALDQTVILLDAQTKMGNGCPANCPIAKARDGALALVDLLMPNGSTNVVGYAPYHNCYGPVHPIGPPVGCIPDVAADNLVVPPVTWLQKQTLTNAISSTEPFTSPSNICVGLLKAQDLLETWSPAPGARRVLVLLSGGDNLDHATANQYAEPPDPCHPESHFDLGIPGVCDFSRRAESQLDILTWQQAERLKDPQDPTVQGVEIFVIGWDVCGGDGPQQQSPVYCDGIGDGQDDNIADQRLLKCIASSPDHYQRVDDVANLLDAFQNVAVELATRSLLQ